MVRADSPLRRTGDVDRAGVQVAVGLKTAYDLFLSRRLERAALVRSASSKAAIAQFLEEGLDAVAGVRQPLAAFAKSRPELRVMDDSFMIIRQASGVPKGRTLARAYVASFIEEAKASGLVAEALKQSGVEASVAPNGEKR
jgi:polar amino acid transport system substrate-binding protein